MILQLVSLIVFSLIAWEIASRVARAYFNKFYAEKFLHGRVSVFNELWLGVRVFLAAAFLVILLEIVADVLMIESSWLFKNLRLAVVGITFFAMFYLQLYRDREHLLTKIRDKKLTERLICEGEKELEQEEMLRKG